MASVDIASTQSAFAIIGRFGNVTTWKQSVANASPETVLEYMKPFLSGHALQTRKRQGVYPED